MRCDWQRDKSRNYHAQSKALAIVTIADGMPLHNSCKCIKMRSFHRFKFGKLAKCFCLDITET